MPKKSRKVASRQAELSRKKRRSKPQQYVIPERPSPQPQDEDEAPPRPVVQPQRQTFTPTVTPRSQRAAVSVMATYSYVWTEVKRIGLVTGLILAILAVLTFVLR